MVKVNKIAKSEPNGWNKFKKMSNNAYARFLNEYRSKDFIDKEDSFILVYIDEKYFNRYEVHHVEENKGCHFLIGFRFSSRETFI